MRRRFGPYDLELIPLEGAPGAFVAWGDAASWRPRKSSELFDPGGVDAGIAAGVRMVLVDFSGHPYINSGTVGALLEISDALRPHGGDLALVGLSPKHEAVLQLLGLGEDVLPRSPDRASALAAAVGRFEQR